MGATSSSNSAPPSSASSSPPLSERPRERNDYSHDTMQFYPTDCTNENARQRTRPASSDVNEEPRSQGPSPYATLRREDWWSQRPSAPSLSNLRPPHQETLLTYAAHMTGWQTAEGSNPPFSHQQHHEAMEFSRVISQLAMANHQLASAHSATLAHLETLYTELRKERDTRRRATTSEEMEQLDEALKKRLTGQSDAKDEDAEERQRLELRVDKLENQLAESCAGYYSNDESHDEVRQLHRRISRLENIIRTQVLENCDAGSSASSRLLEDISAHSQRDSVEEVPHNVECTKAETIPNPVLDSSTVPESETKSEPSRSRMEQHTSHAQVHLPNMEIAEADFDGSKRVVEQPMEMTRLADEIERLKAERSEYQSTNKRLLSDLEEKENAIGKLVKNYEESKTRYERVETNLSERSGECDELMQKFDTARQEIDRLLKEIDARDTEKDTAEAKITSLEQDLQKSFTEKEKAITEEKEKNSELKTQLTEEQSEKKKQEKALQDALDEIQRLKETMKTERKHSEDETPIEKSSTPEPLETPDESSDRVPNLDEFKKDLTVKREARQRAIAAVSSEMERLRKELDAEKEAHSETSRMLELLRSAQATAQTPEAANTPMLGIHRRSRAKEEKPDEHEIAMKQVEALHVNKILKVSDELRNDIRFQFEKIDDLRYQLERDRENQRSRIRSLEEVTNKTKEALGSRERRANELKDHLAQIVVRLGDRSFLENKDDVARECERQLENIGSLKSLYNERLKVLTELKDTAVRELADVKERLDYTEKKSECLEEDLKKADEKIDSQDTQIINLESQLGLAKADCRDLQNQMSLINGIFTQMLLGASSADMDLDRLTQLLQENHDLISDMAKEESTEAAALPKLLLDLIEQVEGNKNAQKEIAAEQEEEAERRDEDRQQGDIAHNLPKVWRVLFELLSCHAVGTPTASAISSSDPNTCYKSVDTPAGPRLVISVSKTYIHLKELILEKKHLEKEMNRMKQLNTHLESKLGEQEKRLSTVSEELTKTWNIVDRMQAQHQQLHTHEKILRYELQQKRKMLQELKQELEYCREKWESARQKNTNTEIEWRSLRREFAARKAQAAHDSFNNSAESGFSDERGDDTDEEDEGVEGRVRLGPRKRPRKESPRPPSPDTESEQPTDTELSDSKTGSSATTDQRTPTPETEAELDETEASDADADGKAADDSSQDLMDPLDKALTNMIQNLIKLDTNSKMHIGFATSEQVDEDSEIIECLEEDILESNTETGEEECPTKEDTYTESDNVSIDKEQIALADDVQPSNNNEDLTSASCPDGEKAKTEEPPKPPVPYIPVTCSPSLMSTMPVFSIGPVPQAGASLKSVQFSEPLVVGPSNRFFAPVFGSPTTPDLGQGTDNASISPLSDCSTSIKGGEVIGTKGAAEKHVSRPSESVSDSDNVSVDSSSSLETVKEFPPAGSVAVTIKNSTNATEEASKMEKPSAESTSAGQNEEPKTKMTKTRTPEEALAAREDRLKRLEEQAEWLMKKMNATSRRGSALSTRLEELHEAYGEPPVPPPMPDVLPNRRLQTNLTELPRPVPESSSAESAKNTEEPVSGQDSGESPPDNAP